jgi:HPt (histidine-containing phosphotransfer) domain-containing protein
MTEDALPSTAFFEGVPGLDVAAGLRTVGGRPGSLLRLLRKYENLHTEDSRVFRSWMAGGELGQVRTLAHTLKGSSGFLGLVEIQRICGEIEATLAADGNLARVESLLAAFEHQNRLVCAGIRNLADVD